MKKLMMTCAGVMLAGMTLADVRAVTPVIRTDDNGTNVWKWWTARHEQKVALAKKGGSKVVFLGDSITHNWENKDRGLDQWNKYFAGEPYKALNLGYSADRTEHVLWRIQHGELDGYEARVIVLMIGTNNTGHSPRFPNAPEKPEDTIAGIRKIIDAIIAKQPTARIILHPIFPRGATVTDAMRCQNEAVNKEIYKFADGRRVIWCDFNEQLLTTDGFLPTEIMPDRLHPRAYGYEVWANAVIPYINMALNIPVNEPIFIPGRYASHVTVAAANDHPWKGKKVAFLGDSITDPHQKNRIYWQYLAERLNLTPYVYGVSGHKWRHIREQAMKLKKEHGNDVDAIMVYVGTNDFNGNVPPGDWFAEVTEVVNADGEMTPRKRRVPVKCEETERGSINIALDFLRSNFPDQQIVLVTPLHRGYLWCAERNVQNDESYANQLGLWVDTYAEDVRTAGKIWCMPVIDLMSDGALLPTMPNQKRLFREPGRDSLHPNSDGHKRLADAMMIKLSTIPPTFRD